jgi:hypothetical protein
MAEIDLSALGEAIDTTWGRTSMPTINGFGIKMTLAGMNQLNLTYQTIVNFASEREMIMTRRNEESLASENVKMIVDSVKKQYKEKSGNTLKLKEVSCVDSVEIIGLNVHNPKRTALFRRKCLFELA